MRKIILFIVICITYSTYSHAQQSKPSKTTAEPRFYFLTFKIGFAMVKTNYDSLTFKYTDQATKPHYFNDNFVVGNSPLLYGGEMITLSVTTRDKIYFDGLGFGFYGAKKTFLFSMYTGFGYSFSVTSKFNIIPHLSTGYAFLGYTLGTYSPSNNYYYVVNGVTLHGNSNVGIIHNTFFFTPQVTFSYDITETLAIKLTGGYRLDFLSNEKVQFTESYGKYSRSATVSENVSIEKNGQHLKNKIYDLSGLNLNIGVSFYFKD